MSNFFKIYNYTGFTTVYSNNGLFDKLTCNEFSAESGIIDECVNDGTGSNVFSFLDNKVAHFRSLTAGANVTVTQNADDITIAAGGSLDTLSNVGAGSEVFKGIVGSDAQLRTITAGANVTVTQNADDITIAASPGGAKNYSQFYFVDRLSPYILNVITTGVYEVISPTVTQSPPPLGFTTIGPTMQYTGPGEIIKVSYTLSVERVSGITITIGTSAFLNGVKIPQSELINIVTNADSADNSSATFIVPIATNDIIDIRATNFTNNSDIRIFSYTLVATSM